MRPDLFAGPAVRDGSHRLLARLANGGNVPAPARQWALPWNAARRARLAAIAALLAACAAAWVSLQPGAEPPAAAAAARHAVVSAQRQAPVPDSAPPHTAVIVNSPLPAAALPAAEPSGAAISAAGGAASGAARAAVPTRAMPPPVRQRPGKPTPAPRGPGNAPATADSDEDVTLLAAMLKHANQNKPAAIPPKDR